MTRDRDFKREVRARMRVTGERYTQARGALHAPSPASPSAVPRREPGDAMFDELLQQLDIDGFVVVRSVVPPALIAELRQVLDRLVDEDLASRLDEAKRRREAGETDIRAFARGREGRFGFDLPNDRRRAQLIDGVAPIADALGLPLRSGGGLGACLPGWGGHDGLHQDLAGPAPAVAEWDGAIFTWPLSEPWDGMRVVPGSHRRDPDFREPFAGAVAPHPNEVHVDASPGDVVINSIHLWKSATLNRSTERRRDLWIAFRRDAAVDRAIDEYWASVEIH